MLIFLFLNLQKKCQDTYADKMAPLWKFLIHPHRRREGEKDFFTDVLY